MRRRTGSWPVRALALALAVLPLAACDPAAFRTAPPAVPAPSAMPAPARPEAAPDTRDAALVAYYARVEADLRARNLLRTDPAPPDAPFDDAALARSFERVALSGEAVNRAGRLVRQATAFPLQRWQEPVRLALYAGPGVPPAIARRDRTTVEALALRLRRATGHPVSVQPDAPNFHVILVTEAERRALGPRLLELAPGVPPSIVSAVVNLARTEYCAVFALAGGAQPNSYRVAVAVIRAELPDLLRRSCLHEEIAQGLGLANDDPMARPSVFNDDEEFALLTGLDDLLLRMLYDPRLTPGLTADQARPLVTQIAAELLPGAS